MWQAHTDRLTNEDQAGSHPGRNAFDVVLQKGNKKLFSRPTKNTMVATMNNDAKFCHYTMI